MDAALLIVALLLLLAGLAPGAATSAPTRGSGALQRGIERQRRLWQRYLDGLQRW